MPPWAVLKPKIRQWLLRAFQSSINFGAIMTCILIVLDGKPLPLITFLWFGVGAVAAAYLLGEFLLRDS